jgi:hypothetical protein
MMTAKKRKFRPGEAVRVNARNRRCQGLKGEVTGQGMFGPKSYEVKLGYGFACFMEDDLNSRER